MKKVLIILLVIVTIAASVGAVYFYLEAKEVTKEKESLVAQNGQLQTTINNIGEIVKVFTVQTPLFPGKEIKDTDLVEMSIPKASTNENFYFDRTGLIGMEAKVDIKPGTPLTKDVVTKEFIEEPFYERDIVLDSLPIGLRVGDYVDLFFVLPAGEEYPIFVRKRVHFIQENVIKLHLDAAELACWTSAQRDLAIYKTNGVSIYAAKYIDPGLEFEVFAFYPVREDMVSVVNFNANIKDKKRCINMAVRNDLDDRLAEMLLRQKIEDPNWMGIAAGVATEQGAIMAGHKTYITENEDSDSNTLYAPSDDTGVVGGNDSITGIYNEGEDVYGNTSQISDELQAAAEGASVFGDEKPIT